MSKVFLITMLIGFVINQGGRLSDARYGEERGKVEKPADILTIAEKYEFWGTACSYTGALVMVVSAFLLGLDFNE